MNNFTVIYKILKSLEDAMDFEKFDIELISPERLGVTKERRNKLLMEIQKNGYIDGLIIRQWIGSPSPCICEPINITITLKGLEYLSENSMMKKAANIAKGVIDFVKS